MKERADRESRDHELPNTDENDPESVLRYSVVIPSRGRTAMLLQALSSVYRQTLPPTEVIVVLDGDVDDSETAVRENYPRARIVLLDGPLGTATARNVGLHAATSEWICLLDDDDIWHSGKQEAFAQYLDAVPECHAVRSGFWQFSEPPSPSGLNRSTEITWRGSVEALEDDARTARPHNSLSYLEINGDSISQMLRKNCGVTSTTMFRRSLLSQIPKVPEDLRSGQDWILFLYLSRVAEWHLVPGRWMFYRVHAKQLTSDVAVERWRYRVLAWSYAWRDVGWPEGHQLTDYEDEYAGEIHRWVWAQLRRGRVAEAVRRYRHSRRYVPSRHVRASIWLPPPVRWRVVRLLGSSRNRDTQ